MTGLSPYRSSNYGFWRKTAMISLDKIRENTVYRIVSITLPHAAEKRLSELGIIRGTEISRALTAPLGDPVAYLVRGAQIALRREYAVGITVEETPEPRA